MKDNGVKSKSGLELKAQAAALRQPAAKTRGEQLAEYREVVIAGQRNFVTVGTALGLIAKERLFKDAGFKSFEAMLAAEFDMSATTAYRLVDAARVVTILSQVGAIQSKIKNQSQALALAPLVKDRESMVLVIAAAEARAGRLTADLLAEVRVELYPHTEVIDGEVVHVRPALVKGMTKAIERAAAKNSPTGPTAADDHHAKVDNGGPSGQTGPSEGADRAAPPDAAGSVGAGVKFTKPKPPALLCPVPRDLDNCNLCGDLLAERNAGYLRCPSCDPRQEHIAEATLDGLWAECRLCTSAASVAAANQTAAGETDTPVEVEGAADVASATPTGDGLPSSPVGSPEPDGTGLGQTQERIEEEAATPPAVTGTHPTDSPAADSHNTQPHAGVSAAGDQDAATSPAAPEDDGLDPVPPSSSGESSPTGREGGRSEADHHLHVGVGGEAPDVSQERASVEPEGELEDGGGTSLASPSSSDPDPSDTDLVLMAFASLSAALAGMDVEAIASKLFDNEVDLLHQHADDIAHFVGRLDAARTP